MTGQPLFLAARLVLLMLGRHGNGIMSSLIGIDDAEVFRFRGHHYGADNGNSR